MGDLASAGTAAQAPREGGVDVLPANVRARLWVRVGLMGCQAGLWVVFSDGRLLVFRLSLAHFRDDRVLAPIAAAFADAPSDALDLPRDVPGVGRVDQMLYRGAALPTTRHNPDGERFAAALDAEVTEALLSLERRPSLDKVRGRDGEARGPLQLHAFFFATAQNYNRLAILPTEVRARYLQALRRFPALVAPLLINTKQHARWRERPESGKRVKAAIVKGRDLVGALSRRYRISRSLVRSPFNAVYWDARDDVWRRRCLQVLDALAPNQRPELAEFERWQPYLANYFALVGLNRRGEPRPQSPEVHRGAFRLGWSRTWETAARRYRHLPQAMADCRDFLRAARGRVCAILRRPRAPAVERLAAAWLATFGLNGLLAASARWHRTRPDAWMPPVPPGFALPAVLGTVEKDGHQAVELLDPLALAKEGEAMHHCVASYWDLCVEGERIFSLRLAGGERATAEYRPRPIAAGACDASYRLVQLRGPCNAAVSAAMRAWARDIERQLNAPERRVARSAALGSRGSLAGVGAAGAALAWLDSRSVAELVRALAWLKEEPLPAEALLATFVAGYSYHAGPRHERALRAGDPLQLVREPENPHDRLAVRLDWNGQPLGYLPRHENAEIARLLDAGERLAARIQSVDPRAKPWERVEVVVVRQESPNGADPPR